MNCFRLALRLAPVFFLLGGVSCLLLPDAACQNAPASQSPTLPEVSVTYQAKQTSLTDALRDLAAQYHFNYVMCEAPQPYIKADLDLDHRSLKSSLDALCKPFDFQWRVGPGGILLFEGKYANLTALPPLTRGEVWAILQDFQDIAHPFRVAKGDDIAKIEYRLTDSLTLAQWSKLRAQGPAGGIPFSELTPAQQNDLAGYVTSREFDFFVVDLEKATYFQALTVDANTLRVLVIAPGTPDPQTGHVRDKAWITTRFKWRGEERYGIGCLPNHADFQTRAVDLPAYPRAAPTPMPPAAIEHALALLPGQIHIFAVNTSLRLLAAKLAEQSGQKIVADDAIADARVSLRFDDIALPTALDAVARPHDWRFFKQEDGIWKIARKRPGTLPSVKGVVAAMTQALPPAVRRYMQVDNVPAEISPERLEALKFSGEYNWKLTSAAESTLRRLYAANLPQYGKGNVIMWNDLPRAAQTDLLSFQLYQILRDTRALSKGLPGYVTDLSTDVIRFGNDRMDLLNLEICGRNLDSKFNSGISLNNRLSPQKLADLKALGLLTDKPADKH